MYNEYEQQQQLQHLQQQQHQLIMMAQAQQQQQQQQQADGVGFVGDVAHPAQHHQLLDGDQQPSHINTNGNNNIKQFPKRNANKVRSLIHNTACQH